MFIQIQIAMDRYTEIEAKENWFKRIADETEISLNFIEYLNDRLIQLKPLLSSIIVTFPIYTTILFISDLSLPCNNDIKLITNTYSRVKCSKHTTIASKSKSNFHLTSTKRLNTPQPINQSIANNHICKKKRQTREKR